MKHVLYLLFVVLLIQGCSLGSASSSSKENTITLEDLDRDEFTLEYSLDGNPYSGSIAKDLCYGVSSIIEIEEGIMTEVKLLHPNKTIAVSVNPQSGERACYRINGDSIDYSGFVNEYYYYFVEPNDAVKHFDQNFSFLGISFGQTYKDFYGQLLEKGFEFENERTIKGTFYGETIKITPDLSTPIVNEISFSFNKFQQSFRDKLIRDLNSKYGDYVYELEYGTSLYKWFTDNGEIIIQWIKDEEFPNSGIIYMYYQNSERNIDDL